MGTLLLWSTQTDPTVLSVRFLFLFTIKTTSLMSAYTVQTQPAIWFVSYGSYCTDWVVWSTPAPKYWSSARQMRSRYCGWQMFSNWQRNKWRLGARSVKFIVKWEFTCWPSCPLFFTLSVIKYEKVPELCDFKDIKVCAYMHLVID